MVVAFTTMVGEGLWWVVGFREELIWKWSWGSSMLDGVWDLRGREGCLHGFGLSSWKDGVTIQWDAEACRRNGLEKTRSLVLTMLSLRCLLHIQVERLSRQLIMNWHREEVWAGDEIWASAAMHTVEIYWTHSQLTSQSMGVYAQTILYPYLSSFCLCQSLVSHCCLLKVIWKRL